MRIAKILVAFAATIVAVVSTASLAVAQPDTSGAVAQAPLTTPQGIGESTSGAYVLGRDDVVAVSLLGRNDFGGRVRVQADGTIQMPLIGKIVAAEHSTTELSETIRKSLQTGGFYADPIVNIEVVSFASRYVTVLGAVGQAGLVPINRPYRLSEILAKVGGVHEGAAEYIVVRSANGAEKHYVIRELATGDASQDPYVVAGDKIYAPAADIFYITGQVHTPGAHQLHADMTVRMAIAESGGLTDSGSDKKVEVTRAGKKLMVDNTAKVQAGDVLSISEKLF